MKKLTPLSKARLIARIAAEKKGENIVIMDMRRVSMMCDWFVLVSAGSSRRINTIANTLQRELSKKKISATRVEGKQNQYWVLLDFSDVVVHIFHEQIRDFYGLERLWSDAPIERFNNKCLVKTSPEE
ncbi:MAG: ribosome silencing factor [Candidatus Omnitrophica bacterium]|nr:ribosome silencing factor [Candidatus Omnitrophota bacterium]